MTTGQGPTDGTRYYSNCEFPEGNSNAALSAAFLLIDGATAADNGVWVQYFPFSNGAVEVSGAADSFSVQMCGALDGNQPADSYDGFVLGSAITATGITSFDYPVRWVKAQLNTISGSDAVITVKLNASAP